MSEREEIERKNCIEQIKQLLEITDLKGLRLIYSFARGVTVRKNSMVKDG